MSLPQGFNPFEHLQSVFRSVHNRRVREFFSDLGDETWDPEITTPRGSLRVAATIRDEDNLSMMFLRLWLFDIVLQGGQNLWPALYTTPVDLYQQRFKFKPQVTLFFMEDLDEVEEGYAPLTAELSFRLINQEYNSFTPAEARTLANRIRSEFGGGGGYRWRKGRVTTIYNNPDQGINTKINAASQAEGRQVLNKLLDCVNMTIDNSRLRYRELEQNPPTVPPRQTIYGKSRRTPRRFPVGYVRFRYAECHLWGLPNPIVLVDLTGRRPDLRD
jgi:hypothetical protein